MGSWSISFCIGRYEIEPWNVSVDMSHYIISKPAVDTVLAADVTRVSELCPQERIYQNSFIYSISGRCDNTVHQSYVHMLRGFIITKAALTQWWI